MKGTIFTYKDTLDGMFIAFQTVLKTLMATPSSILDGIIYSQINYFQIYLLFTQIMTMI